MSALAYRHVVGKVSYSKIAREKLAAVGNGQGNGVWHIGAARVGAEMPVPNGRETSRVEICDHVG